MAALHYRPIIEIQRILSIFAIYKYKSCIFSNTASFIKREKWRKPERLHAPASNPSSFRRGGYTLVEILVIISAILLLSSIVLPSVQHARESARRVQCANNLRQIGLAVNNYCSTYENFPPAWGLSGIIDKKGITKHKQFSMFTRLLSYIDHGALASNINFDVSIVDPHLFPASDDVAGMESNFTVMATRISSLICPSDPAPQRAWTGGTNYRANMGSDRWIYSTDGPLMEIYSIMRPSGIHDGMSHTVLASEKLRSRNDDRLDLMADMVEGGLGFPYTAEQSRARCAKGMNSPLVHYDISGLSWFVGTLSQSCYNHTLNPNDLIPDCVLPKSNPICGLVGARSMHIGGVYALFADGSVRFTKDSVSRDIWKGLGTRNGGEILSENY